jgi:hypothetical protein
MIEALKYGLPALAALFGFWAAARIRAQAKLPDGAGVRLANRFMVLSIALLVLCGLLAVFEGIFLHGSRAQPIIARMDQIAGEKLSLDNDAFAPMDSHSRQIIDNMIRQLCRDVIDLARTTGSGVAPKCNERLARAPFEAPS